MDKAREGITKNVSLRSGAETTNQYQCVFQLF
jgi:hypothetical protein